MEGRVLVELEGEMSLLKGRVWEGFVVAFGKSLDYRWYFGVFLERFCFRRTYLED